VFLDTVGLLAVWDVSDQWHDAAEAAFNLLAAANEDLITTSYVLAECGNAAARRPYRQAPEQLRQHLEAGGMLVVPTEEDWRNAWAAYARGEAGQAGIVDHLSFTVMRRLALTRAFTNDHHFSAAGFQILF
jgi:uncharacterized protein